MSIDVCDECGDLTDVDEVGLCKTCHDEMYGVDDGSELDDSDLCDFDDENF